MYHLSDSDSHDSDDGIRFKTDSTRYKTKTDFKQNNVYSSYKTFDRRRRSRSRSRSPRRKYEKDRYHRRSSDKKSSTTSLRKSSHTTKERSENTTKERSENTTKERSENTTKERSENTTKERSANTTKERSENTTKDRSANTTKERSDNTTKERSENTTKERSENVSSSVHGTASVTKCDSQDPTLPISCVKKSHVGSEEISHTPVIVTASETQHDSYGPALPPSASQTCGDTNVDDNCTEIGPALPPQLSNDKSVVTESSQTKTKKIYGPTLPSIDSSNQSGASSSETFTTYVTSDNNMTDLEKINDEEMSDDECYGPLPPDMLSNSKAHIALEERALQMRIDKLGESGRHQITREEWMTELPEVRSKHFGLGPRQFRPTPTPDYSDRSSWTDTPQNKTRPKDDSTKKVDVKKEAEIKELQKYDEEQEKIIKKHKKDKKGKSLVEIHQINLSKKKQEEGTGTRRPFSRDIDLKVNHFDEAQKKAILKKAQLLDNRFSAGQSKFL